MKNVEKFALFGAVAGVATNFVLKYVVMLLNMIAGKVPEVSIKLASPQIAINIRDSLTGINSGLSGWLMDALGITGTTVFGPATNYVMAAAGGAIAFLIGGWALEQLDLLKGSAIRKTSSLIVAGNLAAGLILGAVAIPKALTMEAGIGFLNVLIAFAVNGIALALIYSAIDKEAKAGIVPF